MKSWNIALVLIAALGLAGCGTSGSGQKQTAGTLIGGVGGALAGSHIGSGRGRLVATAAGAIIGAMIGNSVGQSLDQIDRRHAAEAEQQALEYSPIGADIAWQNPDSGNYGVVTPTRTYRSSAGAYCREYSHTVHIGGTPSQAYGRACRQPDGSWQIEN